MSVYKAIAAVQADLSKDGISKDRKNQQQGYNFRGIDDVYNALAPLLSKHGLCILPRILHRECTERQNKSGGALFNVVVEAEFDLIAADDGSKLTIRTFGEAMDSADKATNKAMSAAYKYAAMMTFAIPTEGDNDADAVTHDVEPRTAKQSPYADNPFDDGKPAALSKDKARPVFTAVQTALRAAAERGLGELFDCWTDQRTAIFTLPEDWRNEAIKLAIAEGMNIAANVGELGSWWREWQPQITAMPKPMVAELTREKDAAKARLSQQTEAAE